MGGGGKFVPFIGEMQEFSLISCCKIDKYDDKMQNSLKSIGQSKLKLEAFLELDEVDEVFLAVTSLINNIICFKLSKVIKFLR